MVMTTKRVTTFCASMICLGAKSGKSRSNLSNARYRILDMLGSGTFGQVVKCQNIKTHNLVAIKVIKNKPAYYNQSLMEVAILELVACENH